MNVHVELVKKNGWSMNVFVDKIVDEIRRILLWLMHDSAKRIKQSEENSIRIRTRTIFVSKSHKITVH